MDAHVSAGKGQRLNIARTEVEGIEHSFGHLTLLRCLRNLERAGNKQT
jgi:hypothetical protein